MASASATSLHLLAEFPLQGCENISECLLNLVEPQLLDPANVREVLCPVLKEHDRVGKAQLALE